MSLLVGLFRPRVDGTVERVNYDPVPPSGTYAGAERWRESVYGSPSARAIGLRLLPTLTESNIYAIGNELIELRIEAERLLRLHLQTTDKVANYKSEDDLVCQSLNNILSAIDSAMSSGEQVGVYIE